MAFDDELKFEKALIDLLTSSYGWDRDILEYKTEKELLANWANILFENNRGIDRLNNYPLTDSEMAQIMEQIAKLKTPLALNEFINGKTVSIVRDNPEDKDHLGKAVSLKIYDRQEIAGGKSRYQIARQSRFTAKTSILPNRRGDFILLINGMPLIHIELKKSGIPVSQAYNQIEKYAHEGVFTGLFSLVQVFVAMTPEEMVYFANPGPDGLFNKDFYFHWADFYNEPINDWKVIAERFLSIPMAHQLIGFYTIADKLDGVLKVMRSYQYYAVNKISDEVAKHKWENGKQRGGYIWHTTGSGKTMTSFKAAQLIADSENADKVVFLVDRIELGTQSALQYKKFAMDKETVQETEDSTVLLNKLKSPYSADTLIITSIQKMSNINSEGGMKQADIDAATAKRIVFIVDECHRSAFGDMMHDIKHVFPKAFFFGFSGTPIQDENRKKGCTTADVFGEELHRYSIADGIRDGNVLGFDKYRVLTFKEQDMRRAVALEQCHATDEKEIFGNEEKEKIYYYWMNTAPMAGKEDDTGKYIPGIEDFMLKSGQYNTQEHRMKVVEDIADNWQRISHNYKFHAILATSSILEAIEYYHLFKNSVPTLKVTALFDPNIENTGEKNLVKEDALVELIADYNQRYKQTFAIPTWGQMKEDIGYRLAHKDTYKRIEHEPHEQIDLLIVVNQMLTGFDSKWLNTLYLDKMLEFENIIQAFSRTNRLFEINEKPHGIIKYYRAPYTMEQNIDKAVKTYSGDKSFGMFVSKLGKNLEKMNALYNDIKDVFEQDGVFNFERLPEEVAARSQFARLFNQFNHRLESAKVQGFDWSNLHYENKDLSQGEEYSVTLLIDERTYKILVLRYKELNISIGGGHEDVPYDIDGYITTISTGKIDTDYMNSKFEKYRKALESGDSIGIKQATDELHKTFATLTQEEQKYANIFLHDVESGNVEVAENKSLRDYITEYISNAHNDQIHKMATALGLDENMLREIMNGQVTEANINEYGRLDALKATVDKNIARKYFETFEGKPVPIPKVGIKVDNLLRQFILKGGFDI